MYYNDGDKSHYNYVAVQGAGDPEDPRYRCTYKSYDYYNDNEMYGDHALGGMGTKNDVYGNFGGDAGKVHFNDRKCSEFPIGQRDMCDECDMDQPDFYRDTAVPLEMPGQEFLENDFDLGLRVGDYYLGVEMQRWLLLAALVAMLWYTNKRGMLPKVVGDALKRKVAGFTVMNIVVGVVLLYLARFFF